MRKLLRFAMKLFSFGLLSGDKGLSALTRTSLSFSRTDMLRHTAFHQFPTVVLTKPINPHKLHNALREEMEDSGASTSIDEGPVVEDYSLSLHNGQPDPLPESDYLVFAGCLSGSIKKDKPAWIKIGFIVSIPLAFVYGLGALLAIGLYLYWNYLDNYGRGDMFVRYFGTYQRPEKSLEGANDWVIELDVMSSFKAEKEIGGQMVKPGFEKLKTNATKVITQTEGKERWLDELYSANKSEFNARFPINQ